MKHPLPGAKELAASRAEAGPHIMMELIHRKLFDQYAEEISAEPSAESVKAAEVKFLKAVGFPNLSMASFAAMFGREGTKRLASKAPYYTALDEILRQSVVTNDLNVVTDAELAARKAFVESFDKNAEEFNDRAIARLNASRERILKGESTIEREAALSSDRVNPAHGKFWGEFQLQEFPSDEELHKWLKSAEVGAISMPVDTEDGISIVKLLAKGKGDAPQGQPLPDTYRLAKCTEKACEKMRYQTDEEMRAQLIIWKKEDAQRLLGSSLVSKAVIEYPRGTNLFDQVVKH